MQKKKLLAEGAVQQSKDEATIQVSGLGKDLMPTISIIKLKIADQCCLQHFLAYNVRQMCFFTRSSFDASSEAHCLDEALASDAS